MLVIASTPLVKIKNGAVVVSDDGQSWVKYMSDMYRDPDVGNVSFSTATNEIFLVPYGYFPLHDVTRPTGDVVNETLPAYNETTAQWERTYSSRAYNDDELAANLADAKMMASSMASDQYQGESSAGYPVTYIAGTGVDPVDVHVQINDSWRTNLRAATLLSSIGDTDALTEVKIRTSEGGYITIPLGHVQKFAVDLYKANIASNDAFWAYMDAVKATTLIADLPPQPANFITSSAILIDVTPAQSA